MDNSPFKSKRYEERCLAAFKRFRVNSFLSSNCYIERLFSYVQAQGHLKTDLKFSVTSSRAPLKKKLN